jgi:hypothetical protein
MMAKHRRETNRSGKVTNLPSKAGQLKEQLKQLSSDQLAEIIEKFLAQLNEKRRLEFLNLLPSVKSHDLEVHLPYDSDEDFFAEIEDFCERVRSEEFNVLSPSLAGDDWSATREEFLDCLGRSFRKRPLTAGCDAGQPE